MLLIKNELDKIKKTIIEDFVEPLDNNELGHFLSGTSKYIRSILGILYIKSLDEDLSDVDINLLASVEIIHNASLLHDDVIDDADLRRGKSTISKLISPKISVLAGDYLISLAIKKLLLINNKYIIENFRTTIEQMCLAEFEQYFLRGKKTTQEQYLHICKSKTALLFSSALENLAVLHGTDVLLAKKLGEKFGMIFQIKNDMDKISAKQDKINGIQTAVDIFGVENTKILLDNYHKEILHILDKLPNKIYKSYLEDLIRSYVE